MQGWCIVSLTEEADLLSQWRAYSRTGRGFCIGFDTNGLTASFGPIKPVAYVPGEQTDMLCRLLTQAQGRSTSKTLALQFANMAPFVKNPHFHEEREWRILVERHPGQLKVRPASAIVHAVVNIGQPIRAVTIGPGSEDECGIWEARLRVLLADHKYQQYVHVYRSMAPWKG